MPRTVVGSIHCVWAQRTTASKVTNNFLFTISESQMEGTVPTAMSVIYIYKDFNTFFQLMHHQSMWNYMLHSVMESPEYIVDLFVWFHWKFCFKKDDWLWINSPMEVTYLLMWRQENSLLIGYLDTIVFWRPQHKPFSLYL